MISVRDLQTLLYSKSSQYRYVIVDIRETFMRIQPKVSDLLVKEALLETIKEMANLLVPDMGSYVNRLAQTTFLANVYVYLKEEDMARLQNAIHEFAFEIYMKVRDQGLFVDTIEGPIFPFYAESIDPNCIHFLVDDVLLARYNQG